MSAEDVAKAFIEHYYSVLSQNPDGIANLFNDTSMMTFEGTQLQGSQSIVEKLKSFGQLSHSAKTIDVQPSIVPTAILVVASGAVRIGGDNPLHFSQTFQLASSGPQQYYVHNSIFRLHYS